MLSWLIFTTLFITTMVVMAFYLLYYYDRVNFTRDDDSPHTGQVPMTFLSTVMALGLEIVLTTIVVFTFPIRLVYDLVPPRDKPSGQLPILLVHGWGVSSHSLACLHFLLARRGWNNIHVISYNPPAARCEKLSVIVANKVEQLCNRYDVDQINIVAHSMGGILSRYAMKHLGIDGKVKKIITLGSPHMGTRLAKIMPLNGNIIQMHYQSDFLKELAQDDTTPGSAEYISIYSEFDNFILPQHSSHLEGAKNIQVPYHGHCALLYSPKVANIIDEQLK